MRNKPLVSCVCVSFGRPAYLKKAIAYFKAQTYSNKELIIISAVHDIAYKQLVQESESESIKYYAFDEMPGLTLGELRNLGIQKSSGEYFCMWDDDDWHHCQRIEIQLKEALRTRKQGTILPYHILYDSLSREAYMSVPMPPPASILCRKSAITGDIQYRAMNRSEDALFVHNLNQQNVLSPVINPVLYIYIFHGGNTWHIHHFKRLCGRKFSDKAAALIADVAEGKYTCEEGSRLLNGKTVLQEFDYFNSLTLDSSGDVKLKDTIQPGEVSLNN